MRRSQLAQFLLVPLLLTYAAPQGSPKAGSIRCDDKTDISCGEWETCCKVSGVWACCRHQYGVCCPKTNSCCPAGSTCEQSWALSIALTDSFPGAEWWTPKLKVQN